MSVYMITYFLSDTHGHSHDHDEECGCGGEHSHDHESCGCGHDHEHSHEHANSGANIIGKIKSLGAWAQFLPEGFFVKTNSLSAEDIFNEVNSVANGGDIIFVTKIDAKTSACANPAVLDWLSQE